MQLTRNKNCPKMERLHEGSFIVELYHALYRTCVATSLVNILPAFIEANMWHHTDPYKTEFSIFAAVTYVCFLLPTSFLFLCKRVRNYRPGILATTVLSIIESALLLTAASPLLYDHPKARTLILGVGVLLLPLVYVHVLCNAQCNSMVRLNRGCCKELCSSTHKTKVSEKSSKTFGDKPRPRIEFQAGSEVLLAVYLTMSLRWCASSINAFYTNWEAPLVLLVFSILTAAPKLATMFYESSDDSKYRATSRSTERSSILSRDVEAKGAQIDNRTDSLTDQESSDTGRNDKHTSFNMDKSDCEQNDKALFVRRKKIETNHKALVYICAIVDGVAKGCLFVLFLWLFTSPAILRMWSGVQGSNFGIIVLVCFAVGIVIASACPWQITWTSKSSILKGTLWRFFLTTFLFVAAGFQLLGANSSPSFLGACLFAVILPQVFIINLKNSSKLTSLSNTCFSLKLVPGVIAIITSITFIAAEMASSFVVIPSLSKALLGKMHLILYGEIVSITLSVLSGIGIDWLHETYITSPETLSAPDTDLATNFCCQETLIRKCQKHKKCFVTALLVALIACTTIPAGPGWQLGHCIDRHSHSIDSVSDFFKETKPVSPTAFSIMSWNVLFGHDMKGNDNLPCLARVAQATRPDIFAVQESDALPVFWGGKDILGYLQNAIHSFRAYYGIEPLKASLGVGLLTGMKVLSHEKFILPCDSTAKLPHYSMTKTAIDVSGIKNCSLEKCSNDSGVLYVFNIHAVYKNWTKKSVPISKSHTEFLAEQVRMVDQKSPVLAMGDFNLNPFESELDVLYNDLGMKSALYPQRGMHHISTILNRPATIDHIFYRGLTLLYNRTIVETGTISDHRPVYAIFDLQT